MEEPGREDNSDILMSSIPSLQYMKVEMKRSGELYHPIYSIAETFFQQKQFSAMMPWLHNA
jgi:hypothetical protein